MEWYGTEAEEVLRTSEVSVEEGLSEEEVDVRLLKTGPNKLDEKPSPGLFRLFLTQLKSGLVYVLLAAVVVTLIIGEHIDAFIILLVVGINATIGVVQDYKAEQAINALKQMTAGKALVRRECEVVEVNTEVLVPGDIVLLEPGRIVPADLRLINSINLQIDESALTGESVPTEKQTKPIGIESNPGVGDMTNMAFMATTVTYGRGEGVVVGTGMQTEIGKIAGMLNEEGESLTPLQKRLEELGRTLGILALGICGLILAVSVFQGRDFIDMFLISISLAVAAIPEGLPAIVAIVLALGVTRMSKANAIVRSLPAVETLGSVSVVCTDKTGTLTQNRMSITHHYTDGHLKTSSPGEKGHSRNSHAEIMMMKTLVLCADATLENGKATGDPTELAGLAWAEKHGIHWKDLITRYRRVTEFPFDSERKLMSTLNREEETFTVHTKGAIDNLLNITTHVLVGETIQPLTDELKQQHLSMAEELSANALRVLGVAYKTTSDELLSQDLERDLVLVGLVGMIDPPREEVKASIVEAKAAGITPVMITGDHPQTAVAIAKDLGIALSAEQCITGSEMDLMSGEELRKIIHRYQIFARVSPEHKVRIVQGFQANGHVVSMTGDGVNDAPSLKMADIGVAMGMTGTDVAKGASDMVLTDDNFSTIIRAVREGRTIYNNIRKAVLFLLTCNFGEVVAIFAAILLAWPVPLLPTQILWINLITDTLPAIALGIDPEEPGLMKQKPRPPEESIFAHGAIFRVFAGGILIGALTLTAFYYGLYEHGYHMDAGNIPGDVMTYARTMAFVVLAGSQLMYSLSMRSRRSILSIGLFTNLYLIGAIIIGFALQLMVISVPFFSRAFQVRMLSFSDWLLVMGLSVVPLVISEMGKRICDKLLAGQSQEQSRLRWVKTHSFQLIHRILRMLFPKS